VIPNCRNILLFLKSTTKSVEATASGELKRSQQQLKQGKLKKRESFLIFNCYNSKIKVNNSRKTPAAAN
jgi:hypothetical protein